MLAETLAVVSAANAAIGQVKQLIGHGNDISSMGRQLGAILTAEETLQAQGNSKKKSLFAQAMGKDNDSFEEFLHLDKLKEARKEIESMMRLYGRPGLYDDWVRFQAEARKKRREEETARKRQKAKNMEYFAIFLAVSMVVGGFILLMVCVKWLAG